MNAPGPLYIVAAGTLAAAAYVWWSNSQDYGTDPNATVPLDGSSDWTDSFDDLGSQVNNLFTSVAGNVSNPNVQAFLAMVRRGEGTTGPNGYRTLYGGGLFNDYSKHPNVRVTAGGITSTAAGAYQILAGTWGEIAALYGLTDFSPASQDVAAVALVKRRGALADVIAGRWQAAIGKCAKEWASLPGSPYGQPTISMQTALDTIAANGGVTA
ncbi:MULTISPECIES: glycoside hydrolase family 104 protein [unclassified Caballeronia]|uniref:glycoside hydrolase family 24 protein n=1 Tax=unclassified Caballeronia TaxID=2646786 RepID=UPI0020295A88|nr:MULTISPECIES: glycoside hydrolase family 104 protein [unclassified Caballeronia]